MCFENDFDPSDFPEGENQPEHPSGSASNSAPNGEGELGSAPIWFDACDASVPITTVMIQLGVAKATAESTFVADVMSILNTSLSSEALELFLRTLHATRPEYLKLRTKVIGTLLGDFIRFCRGANPGVSAAALASVLQRSPLGMVRSFEASMRAINDAAADTRKTT